MQQVMQWWLQAMRPRTAHEPSHQWPRISNASNLSSPSLAWNAHRRLSARGRGCNLKRASEEPMRARTWMEALDR